MDEQRKAVRQRLKDDYSFYAPNVLKIRTKEGQIEPLQFNEAQRRLSVIVEEQRRSTGKVRVIILKGRQMGLSTWVGGRLYFKTSQNKARKAIVVTHKADSTRALFDMTKRFHAELPQAMKVSTRYASRRELYFDVLDSGYMVATAGGDDIGRGETINFAHLSELAFWPASSAQDNFSGLMDAIPNSDNTEVYIESTANGVSGLFYEQWQQAVQGKSGFIAVFLPWFIEEKYRSTVPNGFRRSPKEDELVELHGLDDEQLMFRRLKIAEKGAELFMQEYPCTAEEAFLTTGRPIFNPEVILAAVASARKRFSTILTTVDKPIWEPIERRSLEGKSWELNTRGDLKVYYPFDPRETYYIGCDVGAGVKRDYSVAQVLDGRRRQVATFRGQVDPDYLATILLNLGEYYMEARIIVESNNHGLLCCSRLAKDFGYTNFYTETVYDKLTDSESLRLGFNTNRASKPLIIDQLRAVLRDGEMEVNDYQTLEELRSFVMTEEGRMEAEKGTHDDTVIALALANHINEGHFTPVINHDEDYLKVF